MNKQPISILSGGNMIAGKTELIVPEIRELKNTVENNDWHNHENVFDHTVNVLLWLEKIIVDSREDIKGYLNREAELTPRSDLLLAAAALHDIGKPETIIEYPGEKKIRRCPGHEAAGAKLVERILDRFNITENEARYVTRIVANHGLIHDIAGLCDDNFRSGAANDGLTHVMDGLENRDAGEEYNKFKEQFADINLELVLHAYADTLPSYLKVTKPEEYLHRLDFYQRILEGYHI